METIRAFERWLRTHRRPAVAGALVCLTGSVVGVALISSRLASTVLILCAGLSVGVLLLGMLPEQRLHTLAWAVIAAVATVFGIYAALPGEVHRSGSPGPCPKTTATTAPAASPPSLSPSARRDASIEGGDILRGKEDGSSQYRDPVIGAPGEGVAVWLRISNDGQGVARHAYVRFAGLSVSAERAATLTATIFVPNATTEYTSDTLNLEVEQDQRACITYVPGSAALLNLEHRKLQTLPDTLFGRGVSLPPFGSRWPSDIRLVVFRLEINAR